jgi:hypothetical protein
MKKSIKNLLIAFIAVTASMCTLNNVKAQDDMSSGKMKDGKMKMKDDKIKMKMDMSVMKSWPMSSQMAVKEQMELYGKPNEITPTAAIWHNNGPWKKTVIDKMESKHDFPKTHMDCMEQSVNYRVPLDKYDDLAQFDGSVTVDRTQGTIAARCDKEENNFLALNLSYDVITGKKTVEEARKAYGENIMNAMKSNKGEYMKKLMFGSNMSAPDPDVMIL